MNRYPACIENGAWNMRRSVDGACKKYLQESTMGNTGLSLGIDIGGTFTDLVLLDPRDGKTTIWKEPTTADDPSRGAMLGLAKLLGRAATKPEEITRVIHATTLFTNALIERKGAKTGLITTAGFSDVLEIGSERKYELYDIFLQMPRPLVPRPCRREVVERLGPDGSVVKALDTKMALRQAQELVELGIDSIAIAFLHSYANPAHERQAAEIISNRFPQLPLSLSSDLSPEIREYPRTVTTVANAYVRPMAEAYLDRLEKSLRELGIPGGLFLMLSSGGLTHVAEAKRAPVQLLESGPAAGALAGAWFGKNAGLDRVLAFDMGGTTAKLALVDDGEPLVAWGFEAAREKRFLRGSGLPIQIATVELIEIGTGGGSIAHKSDVETLRVGPESAGALPGPVCYGSGGTQPTVTDADLALGYLNADFFLGGSMRISDEGALAALSELSRDLGLDATRGAYGIFDIANETMAGAARVAIAERGRVPQDYALLATGGAGPVHAWQLGAKLGVRHIVCPPGAGVGSTIGMLKAPARIDRVSSFNVELEAADWDAADAAFAALEREASAIVSTTGADLSRSIIRRLADMRYVGQGSEVTVRLPEVLEVNAVRKVFESTYRTLFGRTPPGSSIQFVSLRLSFTAPMPGSEGPLQLGARDAGAAVLKGHRQVYFDEAGGFVEAAVYDRYALAPGTVVRGPAVFEENESTFVVGPGSEASILKDRTIFVKMTA
jgi:N-methylhydantoinase A